VPTADGTGRNGVSVLRRPRVIDTMVAFPHPLPLSIFSLSEISTHLICNNQSINHFISICSTENTRRVRHASTTASPIHINSSTRHSSNVPRRSTIGDPSFSVTAACVWNSLPADVTSAPSLLVFRRMLKTELCRRSFPDN